MRNKDLSYDIARACKVPIDVARKILHILLDEMVRDIRANKILKIKGWGRFTLFRKQRIRLPDGRHVPPARNECRFVPKGSLAKLLRNRWWDPHSWVLANKFARLVREGDKKNAKIIKKRLRDRLADKRAMAEWLDVRGRLPYPLPKKRSDDV